MIVVDHVAISIGNGDHTYGPADVPVGSTYFKVSLARNTPSQPTLWPNATTVIDAGIFMSSDGGATYPFLLISFKSSGGAVLDKNGNPAAETFATRTIPPTVAGQKVRAVVSVAGGPLKSQLTVEVI